MNEAQPRQQAAPVMTGWPDLSGRTALITGAASGIGRACAERFTTAGARVVVVDRDAEAAQRVGDELGCEVVVADLAAEFDALAGVALEVDILVNNAGVQHVAPVEQFPPERFALLQRIMVEAPFRLARAVLPGMYERGWGRLVHISSVHGLRASAFKSAYVAAKHGLEGLSKVIAIEAADRGVTSNTICPGYVRTPLVEKQIASQALAHGIDEARVLDEVLLARMPLKRLVEPAEVAGLVAFLCGPGTASITGSSFSLDGGWAAT